MLLHLSTWAETEAYLERSKTIVIPIGSNEQHGPTGLLGTDWLCPEIIAHAAREGRPGAPGRADLQHRHGPASPGLSRAPSRCAPRPSSPPSATGRARSPLHGFSASISSTATAATSPPIEAAFSEIYAEASFANRPARLRAAAAELVGPARRRQARPPAVPLRPRQPRHPVRDRRHPVGLSGRDQGGQLRARRSPRPARSAKRSTSAPATPTAAWAPTPAWPRPRKAANWSRSPPRAWSPKWRRSGRSQPSPPRTASWPACPGHP